MMKERKWKKDTNSKIYLNDKGKTEDKRNEKKERKKERMKERKNERMKENERWWKKENERKTQTPKYI